MQTMVWVDLTAAGLLAFIAGARLLSRRLGSGRDHHPQSYTLSASEAEVLTRSKGPFL